MDKGKERRITLTKSIIKHLYINALLLLILSIFFFGYNAIVSEPLVLGIPELCLLLLPTVFFNILYNNRINAKAEDVIDYLQETTVSKNYLEDIMKVIPNFIIILDLNFRINSFNEYMLKKLGYEREDVEGKKLSFLIPHFEEEDKLFDFLESGPSTLETEIIDIDKELAPVLLSMVKLVNTDKTSYGYICAAQDISFLKKAAKEKEDLLEQLQDQNRQLQYVATHDQLTGLVNRVQFEHFCEKTVAQVVRKNTIGALLFIDIDRFREINESMGHHIGDKLLKQISKRLENSMRSADALMIDRSLPHFARTGGNEYLLILTDLDTLSSAGIVAKRLIDTMKPPFNISGRQLNISLSIGIACIPHAGQDYDTLLTHADTAMCRAKNIGDGQYQYFTESLQLEHQRKVELASQLRTAIPNNELALAYQPIYDLDEDQIVSYEVLLRWENKSSELISPAEFIPVAEETGLITDIGLWVIGQACRDYKKLNSYQDSQNDTLLSINISPIQLSKNTFVHDIKDIIDKYGISASQIELEITETSMMKQFEDSYHVVKNLHKEGFRISIDDFGKGFSSLTRLEDLPINTLKIDMSFVQRIVTLEEEYIITDLIIKLGQFLKVKIIAEGIETETQLNYLKDHQCSHGQGYFLAKPMYLSDLDKFMKNNAN